MNSFKIRKHCVGLNEKTIFFSFLFMFFFFYKNKKRGIVVMLLLLIRRINEFNFLKINRVIIANFMNEFRIRAIAS